MTKPHISTPKRVIVVLGMHWSGANAIVRALQVAGVDFGASLPGMPRSAHKNRFEDPDFLRINEKLFQLFSSSGDSLEPIARDELKSEKIDGLKKEAVALLGERTKSPGIFGMKDPRVVRLLPFWREVFERCKLDASYVIALRNPLRISKTLAVRNKFPVEKAHYLWMAHVLPSVLETTGSLRVVVDYDRLVDQPATEVQRMAQALKVEDKIDPVALGQFVAGFLEKKLHRAQPVAGESMSGPAVLPQAAVLFDLLEKMASDQLPMDSSQVQSLFGEASERFKELYPAFRYMTRQDQQVIDLRQEVIKHHAQVALLHQSIADRDKQIKTLRKKLKGVHRSAIWNALKKFHHRAPDWMRGITAWAHGIWSKLRNLSVKRSDLFDAKWYLATYRDVAASGMNAYEHYIRHGKAEGRLPGVNASLNDYTEWVRRYDTLTDEMRASMHAQIKDFSSRPVISVLMPVYNTKAAWLKEAIESVRKQIYPHWELCIADDASTDTTIRTLLEQYAREDERIKVMFREKNGHISAASNSALELASGDWVALLDHDDLLSEHALFWVVETIHRHPETCLIYSDEDKIDKEGRRVKPYFKCDWNYDLFLSHNMISHLGVYKTQLVREVGGFHLGVEGAQDYDLALRCLDVVTADKIQHIPKVLLHWRMHASSTATNLEAKPYVLHAVEKVLTEHFTRRGVRATVEPVPHGYRVRYALPEIPPKVSLIVLTKNSLSLIRDCVKSILEKTTYSNYEILIIDNGSDDPRTLAYFKEIVSEPKVRVIRDDRPFNFSALNNAAVKEAQGELIGLINNDIKVISSDWLSEMVSLAIQPGVGAVGARLWYPDRTLQHGGVITGLKGCAEHSHKGLRRGLPGYFARAELLQSFSAVTGACLVIKKAIYEEVGGLNEKDLPIAFNDVDFCLRVREAGYRNLWTPYAELWHCESATRGFKDSTEKSARFAGENDYMKKQWGNRLMNDPAYSPNLTLEHTDFSLAWPPRYLQQSSQPLP